MAIMTKVVAKICNILFFTILLGIIIGAGTLLLIQAFGYTPLAILSGSMEPRYNVNGLVIIDTNVNASEVAVGDVIAFNIHENTTVTHRVTAKDEAERLFTTKGDANEMEDLSPVPFDSVIGRATLHVPWVGYILMNLKTTRGLALGVFVLAALVVLFVVPLIVAPGAQSRKQKEQTVKKGAHFRTEAT
jgi:signal peptidase